jgi:hypothetical protein
MDKGMFGKLKHIDLIDEEMLAKRNIMLNLMRRDARLFNECDEAFESIITKKNHK